MSDNSSKMEDYNEEDNNETDNDDAYFNFNYNYHFETEWTEECRVQQIEKNKNKHWAGWGRDSLNNGHVRCLNYYSYNPSGY